MFHKKESVELIEWRTDNSILKFLSSNLDVEGNLTEKAHDLPDEKKEEDKIRFAPGFMDAMFDEEDSDDSKKRVSELVARMKKIAEKGDKMSEQAFYQGVTEDEQVIRIIDQVLEAIANDSLPIEPFLFSFAKDLTTKTDKRNAVKFGIAILGRCQNKSLLNEIKILGLHDEFTIFSAIAVSNLSENPASDLWDLAKKVDGWGKIQLVDILAEMELNQEIKDWLILEGYKNNIMYEYSAFTCAMSGQLHKKLESEQIDKKLFKSSADIIRALINVDEQAEEIIEDILGYIYAASTIEHFIRHAKQHTNDISDFSTLHRIKGFLSKLQEGVGVCDENGWNQDIISNCLIEIATILNSRDWKELLHESLKSKDNTTYSNAKEAAQILGIDLWETVWARLQENPIDGSTWYDVIHYSQSKHSDKIIDFALAHLPLDEFATGPKDSMSFDTRFMCLDSVII